MKLRRSLRVQPERPIRYDANRRRRVKGTLRTWARGIRRRLSNLAWGLGATATLTTAYVFAVRHSFPFVKALPSPTTLGQLIGSAIVAGLFTTAAAAVLSKLLQAKKRIEVSVRGDGLTLAGARGRSLPFRSIASFLRDGRRLWLFLNSGSVMEVLLEDGAQADELEECLQRQVGFKRVELHPHPSSSTPGAVALVFGMNCGLFTLLVPILESLGAVSGVAVALALIGAFLATGKFGRGMRGSTLVVGRDGVRLGKDFMPFESIEAVRFEQGRVTLSGVEGKTLTAKVRMPAELAEALEKQIEERVGADEGAGVILERGGGENAHEWLQRIRGALLEKDFRTTSVPKNLVVEASRSPKSPLRVRVAALAALMDEEPEFAEVLADETADPRLERLARAAGDPAAWNKALAALDEAGDLE